MVHQQWMEAWAGLLNKRVLIAGAAVFSLALPACSDASDNLREGTDAAQEGEMAGDTILDRVPVFPADSGDIDNSGAPGPGGGQVAPGVTPEGGAGATPGGETSPTTPPPSSGRDGSSPTGGDNLTGQREVGQSSGQTDQILARAARAYAGVQTLRADFEQTTENPVLRRTTTSRGTLFQQRPDRFAMRFSQPEGDRIVADGQYIWLYYPSIDAEQVIRMSARAGGAGAVDLQAQFVGDPTARFNAVHNGVENVGGRAADVLTLTPRGSESYRTLKVWVDRGDALVRRFEITDHTGVVRRFILRNLTPGADLDAGVFRFTPPEGAHVVARG